MSTSGKGKNMKIWGSNLAQCLVLWIVIFLKWGKKRHKNYITFQCPYIVFYWNTTTLIFFFFLPPSLLSMGTFTIQWQSTLVARETGSTPPLHTASYGTTNCRDTVITQQCLECHACCCTATFYFYYSTYSSCQSRKTECKCYTFKAQWSVDYFVTELDG